MFGVHILMAIVVVCFLSTSLSATMTEDAKEDEIIATLMYLHSHDYSWDRRMWRIYKQHTEKHLNMSTEDWDSRMWESYLDLNKTMGMIPEGAREEATGECMSKHLFTYKGIKTIRDFVTKLIKDSELTARFTNCFRQHPSFDSGGQVLQSKENLQCMHHLTAFKVLHLLDYTWDDHMWSVFKSCAQNDFLLEGVSTRNWDMQMWASYRDISSFFFAYGDCKDSLIPNSLRTLTINQIIESVVGNRKRVDGFVNCAKKHQAYKKIENIPAKKTKNTRNLIAAVMEGSLESVREMIEAGADVNAQVDSGGVTVLMRASALDHTDIVKALIVAGADVNAQNYDGTTALSLATSNAEIVNMLVVAGANVNTKASIAGTDFTPLSMAVLFNRVETVRILILAGADVNARNRTDETVLMDAAYRGYEEIARLLIRAGADVDARDYLASTALMKAASRGHVEITEMLIKANADVNAQDDTGTTVLIRAASKGYAEMVRALIAAGANVNAQDKKGASALMRAKNENHTEVIRILTSVDAR